jgi:hypothetical protein
MRYKHLHLAFLFQFGIALLSLLCIFTVGKIGIALLAVLAFRPLLLEISPTPPDERIWRMYYEGYKWSLILTGATILITFFLFDYLPINSHDRGIAFLTSIPWFYAIHGLLGFILAWPERRNIN